MKKLLALGGLLYLCTSLTLAQHDHRPQCGLPAASEDLLMQRLRTNKQTLARGLAQNLRQQMSFIPITFHVVRRNDGSEGVSWTDLPDQLCSLNDYYTQQNTNLQFYIQGINEFSNSQVYDAHFETAGQNVLSREKVDRTINIFIVGSAETSDQGTGITLGYFSPADDWIVVRTDEIRADGETLYHELGHYFGLPHPFRGWDFEPYNRADHGAQVSTFAPSTGYPNPIANEQQDGANCEFAGDEICDTPPDYNFATFDWGCNYVGGVRDPAGTRVDPDERNIMSYFISCPDKTFTPQQKALMGADLFNRILDETIVFGSDPGSSTLPVPQLQSPADQSGQADFSTLDFSWSEVPDAFRYLLEFDDSPSFAVGTLQFLIEGNTFTLSNPGFFEANRLYYWRVRPIGRYAACTNWSGTFRFFTNIVTSLRPNTTDLDWRLYPNPRFGTSPLALELHSDRSREWTAQLYRTDGSRVGEGWRFLNGPGRHTELLALDELRSGIYLLRLESEGGGWVRKMVVR